MVCEKCLEKLGNSAKYLRVALEQDSKVDLPIRQKLIIWASTSPY